MSDLITEDNLKEWSGYKRRGDIESWARSNGIAIHYGKSGVILTTQAAIDASLLAAPLHTAEKQFNFAR